MVKGDDGAVALVVGYGRFGQIVARLLTCRIEFGSTRIEIAHAHKTTLEFTSGTGDRLLRDTDLASHLDAVDQRLDIVRMAQEACIHNGAVFGIG